MFVSVPTEQHKVERAIELSNSWGIDPKKTGDSLEMESLVDDMISDMKLRDSKIPKQGKYLAKLRDHVKVITSNLHDAYSADPQLFIAYLRRRGAYKEDRGNKGFQFGYRNVVRVTNYLREEGYIEHVAGYPASEEYPEPQVAKMRATKKLINIIEEKHKVTSDMIKRDIGNDETIIVKGVKSKEGKRKIVTTPNNGNVRRMRENLRIINNVMAPSKITLDITDEELRQLNARLNQDRDPYKQAIDFERKYLHRVFLDRKLNRGGRFYGPWYQNIYREYRERILIDNLVTLEFDYSGYHINILYAREKLPIPEEDPYKLDGYSDTKETRDFFKRALLVILNTKRDTIEEAKDTVIRRMIRDVRFGELVQPKEIQDINEAIDKFAIKHEPIRHYFFSGYGIDLQFIDSRITEEVLLYFANTFGVPCLPVHDSFIVQVGLFYKLEEIMQHYFKKEFGQSILIKHDYEQTLRRQALKLRQQYHRNNDREVNDK